MSAHRILELATRGFRNLGSLDLVPGPRFNVVFGENGQGKSNLLEALHYLGAQRSFRGAGADDLIGMHDPAASLGLRFDAVPVARTLKAKLHRDRARELGLDGKRPRSLAALRGVLPMVLFHPGDLELAQGGPEGRRALLDAVLSEVDARYGESLAHYTRALRSRNRLLKAEVPDRRAITSFDPILAEHGAAIGRARDVLVRELAPDAERAFHEIFDEAVPAAIRFRSRVEPTSSALGEALARSLEKDLARGFTAEGPHADDVVLAIAERSAKHHGSQGQQRALVLALKLAELEALARRDGRLPIFLLDDVSSELDRTRQARFFALLERRGAQVFLTTTMREVLSIGGERVDFEVIGGRVRAAS